MPYFLGSGGGGGGRGGGGIGFGIGGQSINPLRAISRAASRFARLLEGSNRTRTESIFFRTRFNMSTSAVLLFYPAEVPIYGHTQRIHADLHGGD
jgi:hypothetical protein